MYKRIRKRRFKLCISRGSVVRTAVLLLIAVFALLVLGGLCADPDEINERTEEYFTECFDDISYEALAEISNDSCPGSAELADFKNIVLDKLRARCNGYKILFIEFEKADVFSLKYPVIINIDANVSGYFKQELKDPDGNIGLYTIKFFATARSDSDNEFVCEAECIVYQQIVKGSAPYLFSYDLRE